MEFILSTFYSTPTWDSPKHNILLGLYKYRHFAAYLWQRVLNRFWYENLQRNTEKKRGQSDFCGDPVWFSSLLGLLWPFQLTLVLWLSPHVSHCEPSSCSINFFILCIFTIRFYTIYKCAKINKKFELMLTRRAKAYSSSGSVV